MSPLHCWMGQSRLWALAERCSAHTGFVSLGTATQVLSEHNWETQLDSDWLDWLLQPLPFLALVVQSQLFGKGLTGCCAGSHPTVTLSWALGLSVPDTQMLSPAKCSGEGGAAKGGQ